VCKSCTFWLAPEGERPGFCRRFPPQSFMIQQAPRQSGLTLSGRSVMSQPQIQLTTNFPPTNDDVWCGEYKVVE
jgi:hypothetical protein